MVLQREYWNVVSKFKRSRFQTGKNMLSTSRKVKVSSTTEDRGYEEERRPLTLPIILNVIKAEAVRGKLCSQANTNLNSDYAT